MHQTLQQQTNLQLQGQTQHGTQDASAEGTLQAEAVALSNLSGHNLGKRPIRINFGDKDQGRDGVSVPAQAARDSTCCNVGSTGLTIAGEQLNQ